MTENSTNNLPLLDASCSHCTLAASYYAHGASSQMCIQARSRNFTIGLPWDNLRCLLQMAVENYPEEIFRRQLVPRSAVLVEWSLEMSLLWE